MRMRMMTMNNRERAEANDGTGERENRKLVVRFLRIGSSRISHSVASGRCRAYSIGSNVDENPKHQLIIGSNFSVNLDTQQLLR